MKFKTVKNGFDPAEVEEYIKRLREVYDKTLAQQRDRIFEQREALDAAEKKLGEYEKDKGLINKSIESAVSKAEEIKKIAKSKYAAEIAALREFHEEWVRYFADIREKYPVNDELEQAESISDKIGMVLSGADVYVPRVKEGAFNPINMIETHLAGSAVEEEKFDYAAAQNPNEDIHNILSDLGIIFDDKK